MKKKPPAKFDGIRFLTSPEEWFRIVQSQRKWLAELADKIEAGEVLDRKLDRDAAAGILRAWAKQIPDRQPGRRPAKIDPGEVAIAYALLMKRPGQSKNSAHEELAARWDVTVPAIRKALKKYGDAALRMLSDS